MVPDDAVSMTKEKILADIDVAMGGHVAERLIIGESKVTSGCGSDLQGATSMAYRAVRYFGMFGEQAGYISSDSDQTSEKYNALVDKQVKEILEVSSFYQLYTMDKCFIAIIPESKQVVNYKRKGVKGVI